MATWRERWRGAVVAFQGKTEPAQPKVIMQEVARADPRWGWAGPQRYNPDDLIGRRGIGIYDTMRRDDQVKAALTLKKYAALSTGWRVEPASDSSADEEVATFCTDTFQRMTGAFEQTLYEMCTALDYGYSVTEKVWHVVPVGRWKGRIAYRALKTRAPHDIEFDVDPYGNLLKILQMGTELPADKFIIFAYNAEFSNWYGTSDLRAAYEPWWVKKNATRWLAQYLEKFAVPPVKATVKPGLPATERDNLERVLENWGESNSLIITEGTTIETMELTEDGARQLTEAIDKLDIRIARAILMPNLSGLTAQQKLGSLARAQVDFDQFMWVIDMLRQNVAETVVTEQAVKSLVQMNFANAVDMPVFRFNPHSHQKRQELLKLWLEAVKIDAVDSVPADEVQIRDTLGMPTRTVEDIEEAQAEKAAQAAAIAGRARPDQQGNGKPGDEPVGDDEPEPQERKRQKVVANAIAFLNDAASLPMVAPTPTVHDLLVSRIHEAYTRAMDCLFGLGYLDQAERMAVGKAMGDALTALRGLITQGDLKDVVQRLVDYATARKIVLGSEVRAYAKTYGITCEMADAEAYDPEEAEPTAVFARIGARLEEMDEGAGQRLAAVLRAQEEQLLGFVRRRFADGIDARLVNALELRKLDEMQRVVRDMVRGAFEYGRQTIAQELNLPLRFAWGIAPEAALKFFDQKALMISGLLRDDLLAKSKLILLQALKDGEKIEDTIIKLQDLYTPYVGTPGVAKVLLSAPRLETIIRTNNTEAFNEGRKVMMSDPDVEDMIAGVRYSAVLDSRTTPVCRYLHGRVFRKGDPALDKLTPPNHFNCRSILVPILVEDPEASRLRFVAEGEIGTAVDMAGQGFV